VGGSLARKQQPNRDDLRGFCMTTTSTPEVRGRGHYSEYGRSVSPPWPIASNAAVASSSTNCALQTNDTGIWHVSSPGNCNHGQRGQQARSAEQAFIAFGRQGDGRDHCSDTLTAHGSKRAVSQQWSDQQARGLLHQFGRRSSDRNRHAQTSRLHEHRST